MCGIILTLGDGKTLFILNVYLPCDNYRQTQAEEQYIETLSDIELAVTEVNADYVLVAGDCNTDLSRNNAHSKELTHLAERLQIQFAWLNPASQPGPTYVSTDLTKQSTIDHVLLSDDLYSNIHECYVISEPTNPSWHSPICVKVSMPEVTHELHQETSTQLLHSCTAWNRVTDQMYAMYQQTMAHNLENLVIPTEAIECRDAMCKNVKHRQDINDYCNKIIECCVKSGERCFPVTKCNKRQKPYWKEMVKTERDRCLFWGNIWRECNKPREGVIADVYRKSKRDYHYACRTIRNQEKDLRKARMLECILQNQHRNIWEETKKINPCRRSYPPHIDGHTDPEEIAQLFATKYKDLYNSVPSNSDVLNDIKSKLDAHIQSQGVSDGIVDTDCVIKVTRKLKMKKSDGNKRLWSNHIIMAHESLYPRLATVLTGMFIHGHTPDELLEATISSLPKDKTASFCDSTNYRGIALISCIVKLYDLILIDKCGKQLRTSDLQFSFKSKHSTVMCNLMMKETVKYYNNRESDVFACFLDASKAFDRLKYDKLFEILLKREMPPIIIRSLLDMYEHQRVRTVWRQCHSTYFNIINGIRQGGVISPLLFTIYVDELIKTIENSHIGCHIGHVYAGVMCYADDIVLLCPTIQGLQRMIYLCENFGSDLGVLWNPKKSVTMRFSQNRVMKPYNVKLNGAVLKCESVVKHLGIYTSWNLGEEYEIKHKQGDLIGRVNQMLSTYGSLGSDALSHLMSSKCCHSYGCETWLLCDRNLQNMYTRWHVAIRRIWQLPNTAHRNILPGIARTVSLPLQIYKRTARLYELMSKSDNSSISFIMKNAKADCRSFINRNMQHIAKETGVHDYLNIKVYQMSEPNIYKNTDNDIIALLHELRNCQERLAEIPGFTNDEIQFIYDSVASA